MSRRGTVLSRIGIRARITVVTTGIVAVALVMGAVLLVEFQRRSLTESIDTTLRLRSEDLASLVAGGTVPSVLSVQDDDAVVQIVDDAGSVLVASENVASDEPLVDVTPVTGEILVGSFDGLPVRDDDEELFRVLSRGVSGADGRFTIHVALTVDDVEESAASLLGILLVGVPLLVLFVSATTWFALGRALRPVERIRAEAAAITGADLDRRVPEPEAEDEIRRLAVTVNGMLDRLERSLEMQRRFVADASHELRTPLTAIRAQLEVDLAHPGEADPERTEVEVLEDVLRMQRLVDDLLLLAQSDSGALPVGSDPVDVDDLVLREVDRVRAAGTEVPLDVSAVSAGQTVGDADQLRRAVRNVLDNAVCHAGTRVTVGLSETDGTVTLTVTDDGPGIPDDARKRIFERFARVDVARARDRGGTGLGLAIANEIVARHGGDIRFMDGGLTAAPTDSDADDGGVGPHGTTVVISLPDADR